MTKEQIKIGQRVLYRVDHENLPGLHEGVIQETAPTPEGVDYVCIGWRWHRADCVNICLELPKSAQPTLECGPAVSTEPHAIDRIAALLETLVSSQRTTAAPKPREAPTPATNEESEKEPAETPTSEPATQSDTAAPGNPANN